MLKSMLRLTTLALSFCTLTSGLARAGSESLKLGAITGAPVYCSLTGYGSGNFTDLKQQGGNVFDSLLNGKTVPYIYCVDLTHNISPNFNGQANVTTNGLIHYDPVAYPGDLVNNAGQVSWLMLHISAGTPGHPLSRDQQGGLQAAIWKTIYGANFSLAAGNGAALIADYNADLTALGSKTAPINKMLWLSPLSGSGSNTIPNLQGLVAFATPEPSSLVLLGTVGVGVIGLVVRRRRKVSPKNATA